MIEPLHPGCKIALARFEMDELGVARAIAEGELASPQKYENITFFALRVTGTGAAYRLLEEPSRDEDGNLIRDDNGKPKFEKIEEFAWRDPSIYLNDNFVARCAGLPVLLNHTDGNRLNGQEFSERIIGTLMFAYLKVDEVWAIARIYDEAAAEFMAKNQISTSLGVIFRPGEGLAAEMQEGERLFIEGRLLLLDHLAICSAGVWDKGGPPSGVDSSLTERRDDAQHPKKDIRMVDEKHTTEGDFERKDCENDMLKAIHDSLKQMGSRLDAIESKAMDRKDAARKDEEKDMAERESQEARERAGTEEEKSRADASEKDSETVEEKRALEAAEKAKEEKAAKDARHDSVDDLRSDNAAMQRRLAAMEADLNRFRRETSADELDAIGRAQARHDSVAALFGDRAIVPMAGESSGDYRRRALAKLQKHSGHWQDIRMDAVPDTLLDMAEEQILEAAKLASRKDSAGKAGGLIPHRFTDAGNRTITEFYGDPVAWMAPFMRGAQSGRLNTPSQGK